MLRDTGLVAQVAGEDAITITASLGQAAGRVRSQVLDYYGVIQDGMRRAFCADPQVKPGAYRIGVRLWIGSDGALTHAQLLGSTGEASRDERIAAALARVSFAPPPDEFAQPVSLVIEPRPLAQSACEDRRAARGEGDLP